MQRFLLTVLFLALGTTPALAMASVKQSSTINRDQVYVGDLFDVAADMATQPVGDAPALGQSHTFDLYALRRVANAYGIDWVPTDSSVKVVIKHDSTLISNSQILDAVRTALTDSLQNLKADSIDIALDRRNLELNLPAGVGAVDVHIVDLTYSPNDYRFKGTLMAESAKGDADNPFMVTISGRAVPNVNVPVLAHNVEEGTVIAESDLQTLQLPINKVTPDMISANKAVVGKEARHDINEGSVIRSHDVRPQQLVKRGRTVTMVIVKGPLRVTAQGRAMSDGGSGDSVRVLNNISNRVIEGTILDDGTVAIDAGI